MSTQPLIAVVEDEEHLAQGLLFNLQAEGYRTHHESDGDAALAWLLDATVSAEPPTAILLDVMLPGRDGFSIVRALRDSGCYTPVLLLTARGRTEDIVEGFAAGADDYLPKPFDLNVLFARITGLLRRMHWHSATPPSLTKAPELPETLILNGRTINFDTLEIAAPDKTIHLTLMEADLLRYLLDHPERIIPRKELLENVWQVKEDTDTRAIDNFIVRLRRYLETDPVHPEHLITVRGVGYRFHPEV
ncbi:response regulator [Granulicella sp. 5B5]|uniref:response regulator transcription factor n=1 Tax=Granulicella sp. 5B5 TaxID=1617967 RepID=UPI0015F7404A|nr:response regulator transcription factor [Granulicella sp. 5B5]QMV17734.1 response regulator [Granulicella sp. 5B5]